MVISSSLINQWWSLAGTYFVFLIVGAVALYMIEKICFISVKEDINERKIRCMETTICKFTGCKEIDVQEKLLLTESFDKISKGTCRYVIKKLYRGFLFTTDLNYQRIARDYRNLLLQKHLGKSEWGLSETRV